MRAGRSIPIFVGAAALLLPPQARARQPTIDELAAMSLEDIINSTATKTPIPLDEAPSVITVVSRNEIIRAGYRSVADVVRRIAGLYFVDDHLKGNLGVRGVNAGARGGSSILKVLINGQPVSFRSDTTNYLGVELIPIDAVSQIEVIRGPVSALYGANAFLGVINVITLSGDELGGGLAGVWGGVQSTGLAGGWSAAAGFGGPRFNFLMAATQARMDRSGLSLPAESPSYGSISGRGTESEGDVVKPLSLFERMTYELLPDLSLTVDGLLSRLDTGEQWADVGPLARSRVVEQNGFARATLDYSSELFGLKVSGAFVSGSPGHGDLIDIGRAGVHFLRRVGYSGFDGTIEARYALHGESSLIVGGDMQLERHQLQTYSQVDDNTGAATPIGTEAWKTLTNFAAYAEGVYYPIESLGLTAGMRVDRNLVYGVQPAARLAVVFRPVSELALKVLYGNSFKAPSPFQLFTTPITLGDVRGNDQLSPQHAHTAELSVILRPISGLRIEADAYYTRILDDVVFKLEGGSPVALSLAGVDSVGSELEARYALGKGLSVSATLSLVHATQSLNAPLPGAQPSQPELYPELQARVGGEYDWPLNGLDMVFRADAGWTSSRGASQPNVLLRGEAYAVDGYFFASAAATLLGWQPWTDHDTQLQLRGDNLTNTHYLEPGFGGVDIPQIGAQLMLSLRQQL